MRSCFKSQERKYILGRIGLYFVGFGEKGIGEQMQNTLRELRIFFQEFREMNALFLWSKGAQIPLGPLYCHHLIGIIGEITKMSNKGFR